jgi:DNA-binding response OmpR family regulator
MQKFTGVVRARVLVVDDHATSRNYLLAALRQNGMSVKAARSVAAARRAAARFVPDVVVSDWRLPDGSGRDVCEAIRSEWTARVPRPRFVLLCGNPGDVPSSWLAAAGLHRVLHKPCSLRALLAAVLPGDWSVRETPPPGPRDNSGELARAVRSELRSRLPDLAAAVEGKRLDEAGLILHQLTASAALLRAAALESALRDLGRQCAGEAEPCRTADAWCGLESAVANFFAGDSP